MSTDCVVCETHVGQFAGGPRAGDRPPGGGSPWGSYLVHTSAHPAWKPL